MKKIQLSLLKKNKYTILIQVHIRGIIYKIIIIFCCIKAKTQQKARREEKLQLEFKRQQLEHKHTIERLTAIKNRIKKEQQAL